MSWNPLVIKWACPQSWGTEDLWFQKTSVFWEDRCGFYSGWRSLPGPPVWWQHPCQTNSLLKASADSGPHTYLWNGWDQSHWCILSAWNGACLFTPSHSWFMRGLPWSKYGKKQLLLLIIWKEGTVTSGSNDLRNQRGCCSFLLRFSFFLEPRLPYFQETSTWNPQLWSLDVVILWPPLWN